MSRTPKREVAADAQASGEDRHRHSPQQAVEIARSTKEEVVLFATGFETTAAATAAVILDNPPPNFSVLSVHKYIPPVMEIIAEMPESRIEGFLAAGHAATITGSAVFEPFVKRHNIPVVIAGFEPNDIMAGLVELVELIRARTPRVVNMFPRCVTREGNLAAQKQLWRAFRPMGRTRRGLRTCRTEICGCAIRPPDAASASPSTAPRCGPRPAGAGGQ
jgi:hydrogenase expression/formation protein HypD